jgi:hypothetical protein
MKPPGRRGRPVGSGPATTSNNNNPDIVTRPTADAEQTRKLAAEVRWACRRLREVLRRGDFDEVTRRRLLLELVVELEIAAVHRVGGL